MTDPHGHLAHWLEVPPVKGGGELRLKVRGSRIERRRVRERFEAIARGEPDPAGNQPA